MFFFSFRCWLVIFLLIVKLMTSYISCLVVFLLSGILFSLRKPALVSPWLTPSSYTRVHLFRAHAYLPA